MKKENKQLEYGALISYISIFMNAAIALVYTPWMVNQLGKSDYALYNLAYSFVRMFLVDLGLSTAVTRFLSKYRAEGKEEKANQFVSTVTQLYSIIGAAVCIILIIVYFFIDHIYKGLTPSEIITFRKLYLIIAPATVISFPFLSQNGILTAYEKFVPLKLCDMTQKFLSVALIVFALVNHMGVEAVMAGYSASTLIVIFIKWLYIHNKLHIHVNIKNTDPEIKKDVLGFSAWAAITWIASSVPFGLTPSIMGIVSNTSEIALFSPVNFLESYYWMFAAALNDLFFPKISRYIADTKDDSISKLMNLIGKYQFAFLGLILIGFICIGRDFMTLWMGKDYIGVYPCAILVFLPDLFVASQQIGTTTLVAKNKVKQQALISAFKSLLCIVLCFALSKNHGAFGASIAICIAGLAEVILLDITYQKLLGINMRNFFKQSYAPFIIPDLIVLVIGYYLCNHILTSISVVWLLIKAIIVILFYLMMIWKCALKEEDRKMLISLVHKKA